MPFQKIETEKLSQTVVHQITLLILRGILRPGERLPAERDLAERLGDAAQLNLSHGMRPERA